MKIEVMTNKQIIKKPLVELLTIEPKRKGEEWVMELAFKDGLKGSYCLSGELKTNKGKYLCVEYADSLRELFTAYIENETNKSKGISISRDRVVLDI